MNPPKPGEESYDLWKKERDDIIASMTRRAHIMTDGFNSLEGVSCNFTEGAMYSFPQIHLPSKVGTGQAQCIDNDDSWGREAALAVPQGVFHRATAPSE